MKKITVIGGDIRMKIMAEGLKNKGYAVDSIGLFDDENAELLTSDAVVFPVPTTKDKHSVFAPFSKEKILLCDIEKRLFDHQLILCCNHKFASKICIDYGALDSFALLNAVPTAEGAIALAVQNSDITLWKSKVLITGFGRVGKILAERISKLGAFVTISARKASDFAIADALGLETIHTNSLANSHLDYDFVFNTLDLQIFNDNALKHCSASLFVDLSSDGGFDLDAAQKYNRKVLKAPSLPGRTAPKTAGKILERVIEELLISKV